MSSLLLLAVLITPSQIAAPEPSRVCHKKELVEFLNRKQNVEFITRLNDQRIAKSKPGPQRNMLLREKTLGPLLIPLIDIDGANKIGNVGVLGRRAAHIAKLQCVQVPKEGVVIASAGITHLKIFGFETAGLAEGAQIDLQNRWFEVASAELYLNKRILHLRPFNPRIAVVKARVERRKEKMSHTFLIGNERVRARLINFQNGEAMMRLYATKQVVTISPARLSETDRAWIRETVKSGILPEWPGGKEAE